MSCVFEIKHLLLALIRFRGRNLSTEVNLSFFYKERWPTILTLTDLDLRFPHQVMHVFFKIFLFCRLPLRHATMR